MPNIAGVTAILMWGMLAVFSLQTKAIPPFQLLFICFSISFVIMIVLRLWRGQKLLTLPTLSCVQWVVHTSCLFGFHFCYFMAIRFAPAIEVSLIGYLWPLLLGIYVAPQGLRLYALCGGLLGFLGSVYLVVAGATLHIEAEFIVGYLLALLCALIWSGYSWFLSQSQSEVEDIGWVSLVVALLALAAHVIAESPVYVFTPLQWANAILLGLGPIGGAFYLWDTAMKNGNQSMLASISFATPVISALALYLFGLSALSSAVITAVCFILGGAVIIQRAPAIHAKVTALRNLS